MRLIAPLLLLLALAACATTDPGWTGQGAEPFDSARHACLAQVADEADEAMRDAAFERCMAERGWHR